MPLLGFKKEFAAAVRSGAKRQTIRAKRKYPIKAGDTLYLYTGLRTKKCRKLGEVTCRSVQRVWIESDRMIMNGREMWGFEREFCAIEDGFESWNVMAAWFDKTHGLPFKGDLIVWDKKLSTKRRKK